MFLPNVMPPTPLPLLLLLPLWARGRPYRYYPRGRGQGRGIGEESGEMGFLESVYSYVFGDGDPNANLDSKVLKAAARTIRANNGAVTAEQLAPFLAPPSTTWDEGANVDESWVLPVLTRLQGVPQVTDDGSIVYVFDDLTVTSALNAKDGDMFDEYDEEPEVKLRTPVDYVEEKPLEFSQASGTNLALSGILGGVNLVGALALGAKLSALPNGIALPGIFGVAQVRAVGRGASPDAHA